MIDRLRKWDWMERGRGERPVIVRGLTGEPFDTKDSAWLIEHLGALVVGLEGREVVGDTLGVLEGRDVVGALDGVFEGSEVVGLVDGRELVGDVLGFFDGREVVGAFEGIRVGVLDGTNEGIVQTAIGPLCPV